MESFVKTVRASLKKIQAEFDIYQKRYFVERPPEFFCLELNGEAGELANAEKKRWKGKYIADEDLADEAADVLIALMNYANSRHIDLGEAVRIKLLRIEEKRKLLEDRGETY